MTKIRIVLDKNKSWGKVTLKNRVVNPGSPEMKT